MEGVSGSVMLRCEAVDRAVEGVRGSKPSLRVVGGGGHISGSIYPFVLRWRLLVTSLHFSLPYILNKTFKTHLRGMLDRGRRPSWGFNCWRLVIILYFVIIKFRSEVQVGTKLVINITKR